MQIDLSGRVAAVTGGASNIGRGIVLALADAGASAWILDRDLEQAEITAGQRQGVSALSMDLRDHARLPVVVEELQSRAGSVDILVNNAGWVRSIDFVSKDVEEIHSELSTNLVGPLLLTQLLIPGMLEQGWGRIVNVSSEAGRVGQRGQVAYSSAKAGILGMTRALAQEVAPRGVTVNAVSPAMTRPGSPDEVGELSMQRSPQRDPQTMKKALRHYPMGRVGSPQDVASAVTFLCSDQAAFITGQTLPVNGGYRTS